MKGGIRTSFLFAIAGCLLTAVGGVGVYAQGGREAYARYCAHCHGPEARGDGVDAARFARPPRNLREGFLRVYEPEELVERVLHGRQLPLTHDPAKWADLQAKTGEILEHLRRLARVRWPQVERGWALYRARCADCHGWYGEPPPALPSGVKRPRNLMDASWQRSVPDTLLIEVVRHGRSGMPALVPRIRDDEARALAAFARLLSPGFELYQRVCAVCHGDDGRGVRAVIGEVARLPTIRFDRSYFQSRSEEDIRKAIMHMLREHEPAMPHFAPVLDRATIRAIVDYLRELP